MLLPESIEAMLSGPGRLRFIIQPIVAIVLGMRDGRLDAAAGRPPYFWSVLFQRPTRRASLMEGLRAMMLPLIVAIIIDLVLQYFIFRSVRLWHAVVVGAVLIALPYIAARAFTNRLVTRRHRRNPA